MEGFILNKSFKILIFGWYHQGNFGDDLFEIALKQMFINHNLVFTNYVDVNILKDIDAVFFGGGSFLNEPPEISKDAIDELENKKIFYLGIGAETEIHPIHLHLMKLAKLIAIRSPEFLEKIKQINNNTIAIPDLVYSLQPINNFYFKKNKSVLIIPNIIVVPKWNDMNWKHVAWNYFKSEFGQFLDELLYNEYIINFISLCENNELNDKFAAIEIINQMHFCNNPVIDKKNDFESVTKLISQYDVVISQRYHGIVLSDIVNTPVISIYHHDKLKKDQLSIPYYGISKDQLIKNFNTAVNMKCSNNSINLNIFEDLKQKVENALYRS